VAATRDDMSNLSVSPTSVEFPDTPVGPDCPGSNCTYALVTITNNGTDTEHLIGATVGPPGPFWPTFGGTCNVPRLYYLPPGESCTFQWGFRPEHPGNASATGTITFESGATVTVELNGKGKPGKGKS
jgi:hypothetical protein